MKAAIVGTGFMGAAHIEALRRLGIAGSRCAGQHSGQGPSLCPAEEPGQGIRGHRGAVGRSGG